MKNWFYIPFLILMAITYTRVSENFSDFSVQPVSRGPASVEIIPQEECMDLPARFNPHSVSKTCF